MENTYPFGHTWYFKLGGEILKPRAIKARVAAEDYKGYMREEIEAIDKRPEPERSQTLRTLREKVKQDLACYISSYRELACKIRAMRISGEDKHYKAPISSNIFLGISLRCSHMWNGFGHLIYIEDLLSKQRDLFDF